MFRNRLFIMPAIMPTSAQFRQLREGPLGEAPPPPAGAGFRRPRVRAVILYPSIFVRNTPTFRRG